MATYNALPTPDRLAPGLRLLVPDASALAGWTQPSNTVPIQTTPEAPSTMQTYVVQSGDTLSELAMRLMGTMHRTDELWSINKRTLATPDALRVGMELRYPTAP